MSLNNKSSKIEKITINKLIIYFYIEEKSKSVKKMMNLAKRKIDFINNLMLY